MLQVGRQRPAASGINDLFGAALETDSFQICATQISPQKMYDSSLVLGSMAMVSHLNEQTNLMSNGFDDAINDSACAVPNIDLGILSEF